MGALQKGWDVLRGKTPRAELAARRAEQEAASLTPPVLPDEDQLRLAARRKAALRFGRGSRQSTVNPGQTLGG